MSEENMNHGRDENSKAPIAKPRFFWGMISKKAGVVTEVNAVAIPISAMYAISWLVVFAVAPTMELMIPSEEPKMKKIFRPKISERLPLSRRKACQM